MPRSLHFTRFLLLSVVFHGFLVIAILLLAKNQRTPLPSVTPVRIVSLPKEAIRKPPQVKPAPAPRPEPVKPPGAVPKPERFGPDDEVKLPQTAPAPGEPEKRDQEAIDSKKAGPEAVEKKKGPLPFLTQRDIDELARKGMPARKPGDNSVTLDTDEFKFISYNRWLKIKVESLLRYPELAAISGLQGTLYIKFDIMKDGSLGGLELLKSSGYKILDDEALRAIRASAPFEPLPEEWGMERYSIRAAVLFYISNVYIR